MLRYFRFFAMEHGRKVAIRYGFGSIDDAIRHIGRLDTWYDENDPFAGYRFSFESVTEAETIPLEEDADCALLCSHEEFAAFSALQLQAA